MRNLLINLTFIFALSISFTTDAFSQRGGMVDVFTRTFNTDGINIDDNIRPKIMVEITEGKNGDPIIEREFNYSFRNSSAIPIPDDINEELDGEYYIRVYLNEVFIGGAYVEF